jgi:MFS transporter, DHA2 family, methylenomycin A resistance protein
MLQLIILAVGFIMAMLDVTAVNVALPDIAASLGVPLTGLVWVVDAYTLTFASLLLAGGAMADRFGARKAYQAGLGIFLIGSVLCGAASGGGMLIAARLTQGIGAALFMPSSLSLLTHRYEDSGVRATMLGIWSALVGVAASVGPLVGGILIHFFGWRSVFWINVPLGLLGAVLTQMYIVPIAGRAVRLSMPSHALSVVSLAALSFVLIEGPSRGWSSISIVTVGVLMVLTASLIVLRERSGAHPILPRELLRVPGFTAINLAGFLNNFAAFGQIFLLGLFFQEGQVSNALRAGVLLLPTMAAVTTGNIMSSRISKRIGMRNTMLFGWGIGALAALVMVALGRNSSYFVVVVFASILTFAIGSAIPAMTATMMQMAGKQYANSAAAALNANRQIGALVGVAVVGTILHAVAAWDQRVHLSFICFFLAYGLAGLLVYRYIHSATTQGKATPVLNEL